MGFERVLLVQPTHNVEWPGLTPPIGLGYLAESLLRKGIAYEILDMNLGHSVRDLLRRVDRFQPDLLGMSMITRDYRRFYGFLQRVREHASNVRIVVGGPHVTIFREKVLRDCSAIDYGVVNDGERALVELCEATVPPVEIRGLLYRDGLGIGYGGAPELIGNLDEISWPRYEAFEMGRYFSEMSIHTSRGCPYHCIFCARHVITPRYRARSAASVGEELEHWYRRGYREFNIEDDSFNLIEKRVYGICDEIERRGLRGMTLRCSNGIRADRTDRKMLARMREVGFRYLAFGVDAGNDRMLKVVRKGETMADIEDGILNACELGYSTKLFFVVGNPSETPDDVEDMVRLCRKYPIQEVHFNNVVPYPGTELFEWIERKGYFLRPPEEYLNNASFWEKRAIFDTPELPQEERMRLTERLQKVRSEVHRAAIRRLFGKHAVIGQVAARVLSSRQFERLYYRSRFWRGMVERFRYRFASTQ